jgi:hypothetical protein
MFTPARLSFSLVLLLAFSTMQLSASEPAGDPNAPGLELSCVLTDNGLRLAEYKMIVYCDGAAKDTFCVTKAKPVYLRLDFGHQYAVRHIATGYRDRIVMINTVVDFKTSTRKFTFDYQIEMLKTSETSNTLNDLPVAVICYDAKHKQFNYSRTYHEQVRMPNAGIAQKD